MYGAKRLYTCQVCDKVFEKLLSQLRNTAPSCSRRCSAIKRHGFRSKFLKRDFFEKLDSHNKAYIFGLIMADGSVTSERRWVIDLHENDEKLLLEIGKIIGLMNFKLLNGSNGDKCKRLQVNSQKHVKDLKLLGCTRNKTYVYQDINIPKKFEQSFWRGFFDGDGCVQFNEDQGIYKTSFAISHPFLRSRLLELLNQKSLRYKEYKREMKEPGKFLYNIDLSGPHAQKIAKYMYVAEGIRMSRKNNIALKLISKDIKSCIRHAPKGMKWCISCKEFKNKKDDFYKTGKYLDSRCIPCNKKRALEYYHSKRKKSLTDLGKEKAKIEAEVKTAV